MILLVWSKKCPHLQGYSGGDEVKMLKMHLLPTSARIGAGSNRKAIADSLFERYGFMDAKLLLEKLSWSCKSGSSSVDEKIGVVVLDDGMQVLAFLCEKKKIVIFFLMFSHCSFIGSTGVCSVMWRLLWSMD